MSAAAHPAPRPLDHLALRGADEAPALLLKAGPLAYAGLRARVARLGGWLRESVAEPGARVACWLPKSELACLMPLAAARAGLVYVPINPLLKRAQVAHILADSGSALLIANPARLATLEPGDLAQARPLSEEAVWAEGETAPALEPSAADPHELTQILYTSGSTGKPKGVMLSHANLWLGAVSVATYLGLRPDDRLLGVMPLSFDYGQNQLLGGWYAGASIAPLDYLTPRDVIKAVGRHELTTLAGMPPLWVQLLDQDWGEVGASLRRLTNTGGALTADLVRRLRALFPHADLYAMYGLTEAFRSTYLDPALVDRFPTSIGQAIPFAEVMSVTDGGREAGVDEEGELVHAGPLVAQGYWLDPVRTAERFRPAPVFSKYGGMAVWSGDRVRRDGNGNLHFVGRRDAMIKTSGNRVSPQEVEEAALATGLVAEAVAVGVADAALGQTIHLIARPAQGGDPERLRERLSAALPNFMVPKEIHWRDTIPLSANGKLDRAGLAAELAA